MSKHTPEPWRVGRPYTVVSDTPVPGMGGSDAVEYYGGHLIGESLIEANARRIVACVNACKGLDTAHLESSGLVSAVGYELIELTKQRDELLAALDKISLIASDSPMTHNMMLIYQYGNDAIAKAKGGAS